MAQLRYLIAIVLPFALWHCSDYSEESLTEASKDRRVQVSATEIMGDGFFNFRWNMEVPTGSLTALDSSIGESVSFGPDSSGKYIVELVATDGNVTATQQRIYEVLDDSLSATLHVSAAVMQGDEVTVVASAHDHKGLELSYRWRLGAPNESSVSFDTAELNTLRFTASEIGFYSIHVAVDDVLGNLGTSHVRVESLAQD